MGAQIYTGHVGSIVLDRTTGKCKGFGFIVRDTGGAQLFFHKSGLRGCDIETLREGDKVSYELGNSDKGPRAENVQLLD